MNRVSSSIYSSKIPDKVAQECRLQYKRARAKIADSQRKYVDATQNYLSLATEPGVDEEAALEMFNLALKCSIICPAGNLKDRMLTQIFKDDRCKLSPHQDLLNKFATGQVVKPAQTKKFQEDLASHQQAEMFDGNTALDSALIEHNMKCLSKIYMNITFDQLSAFLGISPERAEMIIATMIGKGEVKGTLD